MPSIRPLSPADVLLGLEASSRKEALQRLAAEASRRLGQTERDILDALKTRETMGSTALGRGVALPHARIEGGIAPFMLVARLRRPIDYEAPDEELVDILILVLWPAESAEGLMATLSQTCRAFREPRFVQGLRAAQTPEEVVALVNAPLAEDASGRPGSPP